MHFSRRCNLSTSGFALLFVTLVIMNVVNVMMKPLPPALETHKFIVNFFAGR